MQSATQNCPTSIQVCSAHCLVWLSHAISRLLFAMQVTPEQSLALVEYIAHLSVQDWNGIARDLRKLGFVPAGMLCYPYHTSLSATVPRWCNLLHDVHLLVCDVLSNPHCRALVVNFMFQDRRVVRVSASFSLHQGYDFIQLENSFSLNLNSV